MTQTLTRTPDDKVEAGIAPFIIRFDPVIEMTKELFEQFCAMNDDMRIELTAEGIIEIMPPTFGFTGNRNIKVAAQLENWTLPMTAELPSIRQQDLRCPTVLCAPPMRRGLVMHDTIYYHQKKRTVSLLCALISW